MTRRGPSSAVCASGRALKAVGTSPAVAGLLSGRRDGWCLCVVLCAIIDRCYMNGSSESAHSSVCGLHESEKFIYFL